MSALAERTNGRLAEGRFRVTEEEPRTLDAYGRLEALCDPGSLHVIRSTILPRRESKRTRPGDGVVGASGTVGGRPVYAYAQDQSFVGGALGEAHADTIIRVMEMAERAGAPVVGFIASGGARMDDGIAALGGYGRIFRQNVRLSGKVPQISVISGVSAGGGSYSPALTDFVVMTEGSAMFLTGPGVVQEVMGEEIDSDGLGGTRVHSKNGVCQFEAHDDLDAVRLVRELLCYLPQRAGETPPHAGPADVPGTAPDTIVPAQQRQVYDVRGVIAALVDGGDMLEVSTRWARNMVTAFARIDGRPVGVIANQPWYLGGVIDAEAAQKAAKFVRSCNSFGLPLVVLVDTPGFLPGTKQEGLGVIRHGAKLLHAFSEAVVPKVTVVLRKAYGGAYICMNSKDLGADLTFAWPDAEIGIMGPKQAVGVVHRRALAEAEDFEAERDRLADEYADEHVSAEVAARTGFIDELVEPHDTRRRLAGALAALSGPGRCGNGGGNIPL
ncbi:MAG TPA: acyl-CoA carboxylase subunit beta [Baekduia sp.]|nr:acyl-CoA carboxylase subunit beta [Baekduia sp.]